MPLPVAKLWHLVTTTECWGSLARALLTRASAYARPVKRGNPLALGIALAVLAMVTLLDLLTPSDVDFTEFYLLPVALTSWVFGWRSAVAFALVVAALEVIVDSPLLRPVADWPPPTTVAWNALSGFLALSVLAYITNRVYLERERWRSVYEERSRLLRLLERELPRPLQAIGWFARTVEERVAEEVPLSRKLREQFEGLRHHVFEVNFLATELVRIGRVRAGELTLSPAPVDLRRIATEAVNGMVDRNRIVVQTAQEGLVVLADPDALRLAIAAVTGRFLEMSGQETVELFIRRSSDDAVVEFSKAGSVGSAEEFELAQLLTDAQGGRLIVVPRPGGLGLRVNLYAPLASALLSEVGEAASDPRTIGLP